MNIETRGQHRRRRRLVVAAVIAASSCAHPTKPPVTAGSLSERDVVRLRNLDPQPRDEKPKRLVVRSRKTPVAKPHHPRPARIGTAVHITIPGVWLRLADCESGEWDRHRHPIPGSRRWDYNDGTYQGGFNFAPSTYSSYKPHGYPSRADLASPGQQYVVARLVLRDQGVRAWPICGPKVGLTMKDAA